MEKCAMKVEIYGLYDPRDGTLRYIGKANCSAKRFQGHLRDRTRRQTPVYQWMNDLALSGITPEMRVLAECSQSDWPDVERAEIIKARANGANLTNVAAGGNEPHCPREVRASNGRANATKRTATPLARRIYTLKTRLGRGLEKGWVTEEAKAKLRLAAQMAPELFGEWADI